MVHLAAQHGVLVYEVLQYSINILLWQFGVCIPFVLTCAAPGIDVAPDMMGWSGSPTRFEQGDTMRRSGARTLYTGLVVAIVRSPLQIYFPRFTRAHTADQVWGEVDRFKCHKCLHSMDISPPRINREEADFCSKAVVSLFCEDILVPTATFTHAPKQLLK